MRALKVYRVSIEDRINKTLKYIRDNPNCRSNSDLDSVILQDIHSKGFIKADIHTPLKTGTPEFLDINLTIDGQRKLESSNSEGVERKAVALSRHSNPFVVAVLSLVVFVAGAGIIYALGWQ